MDLIKAIVLGIIQGLTEFLPVSSSAHLDFIPKLLGWGDPGAAFTAVIQLGTTIALIIYFWADIVEITRGFFRALTQKGKEGEDGDKNSLNYRLGLAVICGTIPAAVLGLALKHKIENDFRDLRITGAMLIIMALVLMAADALGKKKRPLSDVQVRDGWIVGLFQALALIPGASRSGSTFVGAFAVGLDRPATARFSFLLSIPIIVASGLLELKDIVKHKAPEALPAGTHLMTITPTQTLVATIVAGLVGYAAISFLMKYLRTHSNLVFVVYRIAVGIALLGLIFTHHLAPR